MEDICNNIKLISERLTEYDFIQDLRNKSGQVIFPGFGFDNTNNGKVLNLKKTLKPWQSSSEDGSWLPVIECTNYGDLQIINSRIEEIILAGGGTVSDG